MNLEGEDLLILEQLHDAYFGSADFSISLDVLSAKTGLKRDQMEVILQRLKNAGLAKFQSYNNVRITPDGVLKYETSKGQTPICRKVLKIRHSMIIYIGSKLNRDQPYSRISSVEIQKGLKLADNEFEAHYMILEHLHLLQQQNWPFISVTPNFWAYYDKIHELERIKGKFKSLLKSGPPEITPQKRGLDFQKLFAELLRYLGWTVEESVRTPGEEIDIIISKRMKYWLLECKYQKKPAGSSEISKFLTKLGARASINGIFLSMSGFTKDAVSTAEREIHQKIILLFDEKDIESIISEPKNFETLIRKKWGLAISKRKLQA